MSLTSALKSTLTIVALSFTTATFANGYTHTELDYKVCFTPPENCTGLIVNAIDGASKTIYVQAYSFTSTPIMRALLAAKIRGVEVKVLLDKSQVNQTSYSSATFFTNHQIPVWIDYQPDIAHNKVMIIDASTVITGSFNFTKAAQFKNAENVLILKNNELAEKYLMNWQARYAESSSIAALPIAKYIKPRAHHSQPLHLYKKIMRQYRSATRGEKYAN